MSSTNNMLNSQNEHVAYSLIFYATIKESLNNYSSEQWAVWIEMSGEGITQMYTCVMLYYLEERMARVEESRKWVRHGIPGVLHFRLVSNYIIGRGIVLCFKGGAFCARGSPTYFFTCFWLPSFAVVVFVAALCLNFILFLLSMYIW